MVDKVKQAGSTTRKATVTAYEVIALAAKIAAGIKTATLPQVHTHSGSLPIWQIVAAILFAEIAHKLYVLHNKEA